MEFSAKQIATFIQGEIVGDENATVHTFAKIEDLVSIQSQIYLLYIQHSIQYSTGKQRLRTRTGSKSHFNQSG